MSGYKKYFENGGKNMSFVIKYYDVLDQCNDIWNKIKRQLNIKLHSMPVDDEKYIKAKVRKFNSVIKTIFVRRWSAKGKRTLCLHSLYNYWFCYKNGKKKNYPQIYLEECKYNTELKSELESHTELKWKPELESDSE